MHLAGTCHALADGGGGQCWRIGDNCLALVPGSCEPIGDKIQLITSRRIS
jgi:hypothetical protein